MDYRKPKWNKGGICQACGKRYYTVHHETQKYCPECRKKAIDNYYKYIKPVEDKCDGKKG